MEEEEEILAMQGHCPYLKIPVTGKKTTFAWQSCCFKKVVPILILGLLFPIFCPAQTFTPPQRQGGESKRVFIPVLPEDEKESSAKGNGAYKPDTTPTGNYFSPDSHSSSYFSGFDSDMGAPEADEEKAEEPAQEKSKPRVHSR